MCFDSCSGHSCFHQSQMMTSPSFVVLVVVVVVFQSVCVVCAVVRVYPNCLTFSGQGHESVTSLVTTAVRSFYDVAVAWVGFDC